jgi:hypothetical protein
MVDDSGLWVQKNLVAISVVKAPGWYGIKTQEYLYFPSFRNADGQDASASGT